MNFSVLRWMMFLLVSAVFCSTAQYVGAEELLVFVSAFTTGDEGAIHAFQLNSQSGQLKLIHRNKDVQNPFFLAVSPDNKYLYSIHAPGEFGGSADEQVAAFSLVGRTGQLKLLNRQSARGSAACYLDVDKTGKSVLVANYSTGSVASFGIRKDGSLTEATSFIQHMGSSVDKSRQMGPHAHCIVISPDNQFAFAADLGLDQILSYGLDPKTAKLSPSRQPFVRTPPGAGPRHLTFHPNG